MIWALILADLNDSGVVNDILAKTGMVAEWSIGSRAQLRYLKKAVAASLVSNRLVEGGGTRRSIFAKEMATTSENFHSLKLPSNAPVDAVKVNTMAFFQKFKKKVVDANSFGIAAFDVEAYVKRCTGLAFKAYVLKNAAAAAYVKEEVGKFEIAQVGGKYFDKHNLGLLMKTRVSMCILIDGEQC